ncbi:hypothetical protein [Streptomyces sp. SP18CS02]|uniref:hypothetical protein n=1 Tax=Streptomyces sp. SP18CS02 TaxID=3002531 RepID=UPI002E76A727|nr:hypothetical protein [Streptomyces sp. SP18CS02]MEE1751550.1 hypothetical protein [Streptomyces sp. SP18CS02]
MSAVTADGTDGGEAAPARPGGTAASKALWVVTGAVSAWATAQITRGVELEGPAGQQAAVVLMLLAVAKLAQLPFWVWRRGTPRLLRARGIRTRAGAVSCTLAVFMLVGGVVVGPATWWLAESLCGLLDLPFRISGFWPYVVASLVDLVLMVVLKALSDSCTREGRSEGAVGRLARLTACFGVLCLLTAGTGTIRLGQEPWWRSLLTLVVLGALFSAAGLGGTLFSDLGWPGLRRTLLMVLPVLAVGSVAATTLLLWWVTWFSTALRPTAALEGFGSFLTAGLIATAMLWAANLPFFLYGLRRRGHSLRTPPGGYGATAPVAVRANGFGYVWLQPSRSPGAGEEL